MKKIQNRIARIAATVAASAVLVALAPASYAQGDASQYRIGVQGYVPVICRISVDAAQIDTSAATASLGNLNEFCNNGRGYQVVADYSPVLAGASLIVDGVEVPLNNSGTVMVSRSANPAMINRKVELKLAGSAQPGALSFRIMPL